MASHPQGARGACIVGIGQSRYTRRGLQADIGEWALAVEAALAAAADAGLDPAQIDGLASFSGDTCLPWLMGQALGMREINFASMVWGGGGSGACGALAHAAAAVESGQAQAVLVLRSIVQRSGTRYGEAGGFSEIPHLDLMAPHGMLMPAAMFAPVYMRYLHEHPAPEGTLAEIALTFRDHAQHNPRAVTYGQPLNRPQYEAARWIAEPLRLYDCCQESDGACAVLVTTAELASHLHCSPVQVLAAQQGGNSGWYAGGLGAHTMPAADYGSGNMAQLAARLYARAGVGPLNVDFAQLYDHFSPAVLLGLEDFGLCQQGQAGHFVCDGGIRHGGALPVNTAGGLLSEAYIHGLNLVVEAVRQLRGQSTRQVPGARVGLVTAGAGSVPTSAALLAS